jgi:hypothetical protein
MPTLGTLVTQGLFRDANWPGTYLQGEAMDIGLELHYEVIYTEGPIMTDPPTRFTFPATSLSLVELGVPVPGTSEFAPPHTEAEIQAFISTLTWAQWMAEDAPFILRTVFTWNFAETPDVEATPDIGGTCQITRATVVVSSSTSTPPFGSAYGLDIGSARWCMLRVPEATRTPPAGFLGFQSRIDLRPHHGLVDDMLMVAKDPHWLLLEPD